MAISFVGSATASAANGGSVTVTLSNVTPGTVTTGDLILALPGCGDTVNNSPLSMTTAGYTSIISCGGSSTISSGATAYYKFHNGTDTNVVMAAVGGTDAANGLVVMVFRGVKAVADGGPTDGSTAVAAGVTNGLPDPPSFDHSNGSGIWMIVAAVAGHSTGAAATFTFPTGYTTNAAQVAANDTSDVTVGLGYRDSGFSDPENPAAFGHSGAAASRGAGAAMFALAPAPTATGPGFSGWNRERIHRATDLW